MKLNPPASSSDLEAAREIARRLHQRRRREDLPASPVPHRAADSPPAAPRITSAPPPETVVRPATPSHAQPAAPAHERPPAARSVEPAAARGASRPAWEPPVEPPTPAPRFEEPAPPSWDVAPLAPEPEEEGIKSPDEALDALTAPVESAPPPDIETDSEAEPEAEPEPQPEPPAIALDDEPEPGDAAGTFDEADAYGGSPQAALFEEADALEPPDLESPDLGQGVLDTPEVDSAPSDGASEADIEIPLAPDAPGEPDDEELFDDAPGPSWGDVVEACMALANARGALLADSGGELVAARGEWPDPGAQAIASKLVAMMDRTLKDAPTRPVSAPVGNLHLTAWRVPVEGSLLTVVFIADSQVRSEARPSIEAEVQRGAAA